MARPPLVVGVAELQRRPGTQRELHVAAPLDDVATSAARVPAGADVAVDGVLESIEGGRVTLTAVESVPWTGACRRCLEPVHGVAEVELREVFEPAPVEGETYLLTGDELDLGSAVRDAALLALPLAPLCRDDCAGPAPEVFPTGPDDSAEPEPQPDPRWAKLRELDLGD